MNRREFLGAMAVAPLAIGTQPASPVRRTFEITTRIELPEEHDAAIALGAVAAGRGRHRIKSIAATRWAATPTRSRVVRLPGSGTAVAVAEWGHMMPRADLRGDRSRRDHESPGRAVAIERREAHRRIWPPISKPAALIPIDGIVKETADAITRGHRTPLAQARAIYDWIVEHTVRDPEVKGCGLGDIRWMLETKNLRGKCADLNALFVGLSRAAGLPARDLLRPARGAVDAVSQPGPRRRQRHHRAALPRRGVDRRHRLDARRSRGRAQADSRRAARRIACTIRTSPRFATRCSDPGK